MRDEVKRILKLVQEGKLSADDAYELIEAFEGAPDEEASNGDTPPPPPPPPGTGSPSAPRDPFKSLVEAIEKLGKDAANAVNWQEVAKQARESAHKAGETIKAGFENVRKSGGFGFLGGYESRELTLPLSVPEGKTLRIENPCGDVKIVSVSEPGSITANAKFSGTGDAAREKADAYTLIIEESDTAVVIKQPDVTGLSVDLEVSIAGAAAIDIRSESGGVEVENTGAGCRVQTRSGDVRVKGLNGQIEISAMSGDLTVEDSSAASAQVDNKSGDITLRRVNGSANVRTTSGDIRIRDCELKTLAVEGVSGDVDVDLRNPVLGAVNIRTVSGDTVLAIPDGSDCRVGLKTLRGHVSCGVTLWDEARVEGQTTGRLGDGKGTIDVSAVTGDISLEMHVTV